jgi:lysophospholipase L1-like esterase
MTAMVPEQKRVWWFILPIATFLVLSVPIPAVGVTKIMPLGDSITRGVFGSPVNKWGYRRPLYVNLVNGGYSFDFVGSLSDGSFPDPNHEGHDGWRADQLLTYIWGWLVAQEPDVVLLHIGTNDISAGNQDANKIDSILNVVEDYESENGRRVTVVLALIINRRTYSQATTEYNNEVEAMAISRIAGGDDIIIVDMEGALNYSTDMYDDTHPNDDGYAEMANVWYNALVGYFNRKTLTISSTDGGNVTTPGEGVFRYNPGDIASVAASPDTDYYFVNWTGTAVDAGRTADPNTEITTVLMDANYTITANFAHEEENTLKEVNSRLELRASGELDDFTEYYAANGWKFDVAEDFAVKVDFHYSDVSAASSCTGHWKMNDNAASRTVIDSSGNRKNGTALRNTDVLHTTGKIDGALIFNGTSDYVNLGNAIGTGAYTKVAWVKREAGATAYNIISGNAGHFLWAPHYTNYMYNNKLTAGHNNIYNIVQDTVPLDVNVWYQVAVTFDPNVSLGRMVLYKNGVEVNEANNVPLPAASTNTYIGRFSTGSYFKGAIDNAMIFNRALTAEEIAALYNGGNGTEDLEVKVDFRYDNVSLAEGWIGMSVGDDANYVTISVGSHGIASCFYYEAAVDGNVVFEQEPRTSNDGTLYISYDAALKRFYLSHTGFGSENAYVLASGQWGLPVDVYVGGGSSDVVINPGEAYLDNFEMAKGGLLGWPPATDIDENGFIEIYDLAIMCENWLGAGEGDVDNDGVVDFLDFAEFGLAW